LVDRNFQGDVFSFFSWNLVIKPIVEIMTRWSVVEETKCRETNEAFDVEWTSGDKDLKGKEAKAVSGEETRDIHTWKLK